MTLREAVEKLVAQAKEGALTPNGVNWVEVPGADAELGAARLQAPKRVNFAAILQNVASPPPSAPAPTAPAPAPTPTDAPKARILPGNRLLIQVARQPKRKKGEVRWDYEAPPAPAPAAPQVLYKKDPPAAPAPVATPPLPEPAAPIPDPTPAPKPDPVQQTLPLVAAAEPTPGPATVPAAATVEPLAPLVDRAVEVAPPMGDEPETIRIDKPGLYSIDVKRLLEDSPIVVQRDGTYLIHLPSLFDANQKARR